MRFHNPEFPVEGKDVVPISSRVGMMARSGASTPLSLRSTMACQSLLQMRQSTRGLGRTLRTHGLARCTLLSTQRNRKPPGANIAAHHDRRRTSPKLICLIPDVRTTYFRGPANISKHSLVTLLNLVPQTWLVFGSLLRCSFPH